MLHSTPIILTIPLLSLTQLAQSDTTVTKIPPIGNTPTFVDLDHDGDLDFFIKADDGTIEYHENTGDAPKPIKERNSAAKPSVGQSTRTPKNATRNSLDILTVTKNLYLSPEQSAADLFLTVNDPQRVKSATVTIILPKSDDLTEDEREVMVELPNLSCQFSGPIENVFNAPGPYQVHYFVTDNETDDILRFSGTSMVYKNQAGNQAPAAFNLFSPHDGATTKTAFEFDWEETTDPESDLVTYNLTIAEDIQFKNVVLQHEDIFDSEKAINDNTVLEDGSRGISDSITYYWKVDAVDNFGAITPSRQVFSFNTESTNEGFNLLDLDIGGILGEPVLPDPLVIDALEWGRYLVILTETAPQIFTLTSATLTDQVDKYEAHFHPLTKKMSVPSFGAMELIPDSNPLQFKLID
ncbi:MAG: hypothetical protein DRR19_17920 [Candidatus Parabeggiatoa sp. nov. 1]|nr:MAG: hypothetical protein DRR19_17920 [Gammaproteobacteria bacterium]